MRRLYFFDKQFNYKDVIVINNFNPIVDIISTQSFKIETQLMPVVDNGDICILKDNSAVVFIGNVLNVEESEKKTKTITISYIDELFNINGEVADLSGNIITWITNTLTTNFISVGDNLQKISLSIVNNCSTAYSGTYTFDSTNIKDCLRNIFNYSGVYVDFDIDFADNGSIDSLICNIRSNIEEETIKLKYNMPIISEIKRTVTNSQNINKLVLLPDDTVTGGSRYEFYLLKDGTISTDAENVNRFENVKQDIKYYASDFSAESLLNTAKEVLGGEQFNHSIGFFIKHNSSINIGLYKKVIFYDKESVVYNSIITKIQYGTEFDYVELGVVRLKLTDKLQKKDTKTATSSTSSGGGSYVLPQATSSTLGGIIAETKTTETNEVKIDPATGKLYASGVGSVNMDNVIDGETYVKTENNLSDTLKSNYDTAYTNNHTHSNKTILDNTTASYTTAEQTKLGAISGTNTGDETASTIKTKLGITTLSGSNTGDQDLSGKANVDASNLTDADIISFVDKFSYDNSDNIRLNSSGFAEYERQRSKNIFGLPNLDIIINNTSYIYYNNIGFKLQYVAQSASLKYDGNLLIWKRESGGDAFTNVQIKGLKPNTSYRMSFTVDSATNNCHAFDIYHIQNQIGQRVSITKTSDSNGMISYGYGFWASVSQGTLTLSDIQLEEGSVTTDFKEYEGEIVHKKELVAKLDKTTSGSLRRVYGVNASNSQELTEIENTPTISSINLVTSGGIKTALDNKLNIDIIKNTYDNSTTAIYSSKYIEDNFAQMLYTTPYYANKTATTTADLTSTIPTLSASNYLSSTTTNTTFNWTTPNFVFTNTLTGNLSLQASSLIYLSLPFSISLASQTVNFGYRVKMNGVAISSNQTFGAVAYTGGSGHTTVNRVYLQCTTDSLTEKTNYVATDVLTFEVFTQQATSTSMVTRAYCGATIGEVDYYTFNELTQFKSQLGNATPTIAGTVYGQTSNTDNNTFYGYLTGYSNTTGNFNTANGFQALSSNTTGYQNTANGFQALYSNTTGSFNTANGYRALSSNTTGSYNTANGLQALSSNTTGIYNTANGLQALSSNTTGSYNTANGFQALSSNKTGSYNTANGFQALSSNKTSSYNTANGYRALSSNTTGSYNTANGYEALSSNTTGTYNTANGYRAGRYITGGSIGNTISEQSVYIGANTKALADNQTNEIVIGYDATGHGSNTATWGNTEITDHYFTGNVKSDGTDLAKVDASNLTSGDVDSFALKLINKIYPVGSIYMSVVNTSPASFIGGTWTQLKDTFLLAHGDNYTSTASSNITQVTAESGSATHTLTITEMPSHNHTVDGSYNAGGGFIGMAGGSGTKWGNVANTTYVGSGQAHNNMPPYLVVYMWKRTA